MKKILLLFSFISFIQLNAQNYLGYNQSNYAGVTGIYQQPASIVDGRMKFDMTLIGFDVYAYNNYVGMKRTALKRTGSITSPTFTAFEDPNFADNYLVEKINDKFDVHFTHSSRINNNISQYGLGYGDIGLSYHYNNFPFQIIVSQCLFQKFSLILVSYLLKFLLLLLLILIMLDLFLGLYYFLSVFSKVLFHIFFFL